MECDYKGRYADSVIVMIDCKNMDRKWMNANRLSKEYRDGVKEFIRFVVEHAEVRNNKYICPCLSCCYSNRVTVAKLEGHLVSYGIDQSYTNWTKHGETEGESSNMGNTHAPDDNGPNSFEDDRFEEMVNVIEEDLRDCPQMFETLVSDAEKPLYVGCTKFTRLSSMLKLYNLKSCNGWTDKSFTELLALVKEMLPDDNVLPSRTYEAKQMLRSIGMGYEKIHACPNDCILFRNEHASLKSCPKCKASRYKKMETESAPEKVMWYFPIIPRFRRMYRSPEDAKPLTWHEDERIKDST